MIAQSKGNLATEAIVETEPQSARPFTAEEHQAFLNGMLTIFVFAEVTYEDVFGMPHTTNVRLLYSRDNLISGSPAFSTDIEGNSAT